MAQKLFIYSITLFFLLSCTQKPAEKPSYSEYTGILVVVGNEPFSAFALDDGQGHITRLQYDKRIEGKLNTLQGRKVRVYGLPLPEEQRVQLKSIDLYKKKTE